MQRSTKLSDEQEFSIMVNALTNVITGTTTHTSPGATISLPCTSIEFRVPAETEACQFCKINDYTSIQQHNNNTNTTPLQVQQQQQQSQPSPSQLQKGMNTEEEEFWDELMNSDNEIQHYCNRESSDSVNGYIAHSF
ncbi:hypothetical protein H5410_052269 [Solanum commersonii]|uniref:Uncharacterized protein n=1 Tax=Solanum commersonii TaxID=4109 RepID=A0A9J5X0Z2_SOLCO|nr:hypothetical protein H5410_052269 [Solanum commersonii]